MRRTLGALGAVVALVAGLMTGATQASAQRPHGTMLVIGDSITARYAASGTNRGWWSVVAERAGMTPVVSAESGSGFLMHGATLPNGTRGGTCRGSDFTERLHVVSSVRPDAIVVAGGRNDYKVCRDGRARVATKAETKRAIARYMKDLSILTKSLGIPRTIVYVTSPWGTYAADRGRYVRPWVKQYAERYGFTWIPTRSLEDRFTVDGTHPNAAGNAEVARRVLAGSNLAKRSW